MSNFENGVGRGVGTFLVSCTRRFRRNRNLVTPVGGDWGGGGAIPGEKPHAKTSPDNILFSRGYPLGGGPVSGWVYRNRVGLDTGVRNKDF